MLFEQFEGFNNVFYTANLLFLSAIINDDGGGTLYPIVRQVFVQGVKSLLGIKRFISEATGAMPEALLPEPR